MRDYQKHNLLSYIQENELEEFTLKTLYKRLTGHKYYYCYYYTMISDSLSELVKEGKLDARYISETIEPLYNEYSYDKPYRKRNNVGSKTISVYRYVKNVKKM